MTHGDDDRFIHEGRGLGFWLRELLCDDTGRRDRAVDVLGRMHCELTQEILADKSFDTEAHVEVFNAAVRETLDGPDFDAKQYVERLLDFIVTAQNEQTRLTKEENERLDRVLDKLTARLGPNPTREEKDEYLKRVRRAIRAGCDEKNERNRRVEELIRQSTMAGLVFGGLREQLLLVPDRVRAMLHETTHAFGVGSVLERMGAAAAPFADDLIALLDAGRCGHHYSFAKTLAAVVGSDPQRVGQVVDRLDSPDKWVSIGAASTLGILGPKVGELAPECVEKLRKLTAAGDLDVRCPAISALGDVTAGTDVAVDWLLELSRDEDGWVKGAAISALGRVARQPQKVVPRLIEAFDDYEEQDPDYTHDSDHELVVKALQAFGAEAAPAVPALVEHIWREPYENERPQIDAGVVETLGKIGPAAHEALSILEKLALEPREEDEDYDEEDDFEEEDFEDEDELDEQEDIHEEEDLDDEDSDEPDFLAVAIARIRGEAE